MLKLKKALAKLFRPPPAAPARTSLRLSLVHKDEDEHIAYYVASTVARADGTPVVDHHGHVITTKQIEVTARTFMERYRAADYQHEHRDGIGTVFASLVLTPEIQVALAVHAAGFEGVSGVGLAVVDAAGVVVLKGLPTSWVVGVHVTDLVDTWPAIKAGDLGDMSIDGWADIVDA